MELSGSNFVGYSRSAEGANIYTAQNPIESRPLEPGFHEATPAEIDRTVTLAGAAFHEYRELAADQRAAFLNTIAANIDGLGEALIERGSLETGLGANRLRGERARTSNQIRMFADLVVEGSWVEARIDRGNPDRTPAPKPDLRRMLIPIGPVVVFGASNFPLAFSVAGGDTASALAAGCPVIVKAHPAHPGTSEMVGRAIVDAARETGMPDGVFSLLHGPSNETGLGLVRHPGSKAVAFTGSLGGGRALFDAAAARPEPIPVYAEMGSVNPVFVLPRAAAERGKAIAKGLQESFTLGVGQFCTKPGLVIGLTETIELLAADLEHQPQDPKPMVMLHEGIARSFWSGIERLQAVTGVEVLTPPSDPGALSATQARPVILKAEASTFFERRELAEEVFGPVTVMIACSSSEQMVELARRLDGHLTATVHAEEDELESQRALLRALELTVGRLLLNGFPTGIEVGPAVQHGGPYPATTDSRSTSVGTAAVYRFARPICYQDFPQAALPLELKDDNPREIWRLVDGEFKKS
ncbi:MAG: aldehyde dehydrogenase (NADP(+)) [Trueperaceae bacterium]